MVEQHNPPLEIAPPAPPQALIGSGTTPKRRRWLWVVLALAAFVVLGLALYLLWPRLAGAKSNDAASKGPAPIPVMAATSRKGNIGVYYSGLGAVTPLATVTVRTRVDGQLMSVRYREGDTVHQGRSVSGN